MQQPMSQQDQIGCQQAMHQQMVLCPVRFVYETQILVPPGDQIQPNQTFIINPQNPPPWAHNRPIQNQVVYVQQLPSNILPPTQQHMDQNQLYLQQNFAHYQIQQPMLVQNQEIRQMIMATNMMQNERDIGQSMPNTNQMQANTQMIQNHINRPAPNQMNQTMEVQRPYMRPQMTQQTITRPIMSMNQMQNVPTQPTFANVIQHVNYGQPALAQMPNVGQPRPVTQNIQRTPSNIPNTVNVQPVAKVRDTTPVGANKVINHTASGVPTASIANINHQAVNTRHFLPNYTYRPIQPRPQVRHSSTQIQLKPVQNSTMYIAKNTPHNIPANSYLVPNNNSANRKRKSESPDEIQKKINISLPNYNAITQSITVTKLSNEIGVNTSPVHRIDSKNIISNNAMLQINPNNAQIMKIDQKADINAVIPENITNMSGPTSEKDKLIRNTVFTQARGRVLHDKSTSSHDMTSQTTEAEVKPEITTPAEIKPTENEIHTNVNAEIKATAIVTPEIDPEINKKYDDDKPVVPNNNSNVIKAEKDVNNDKDGVNDEKLDDNDKIVLKQDRDSILTHVLDGYVIQESSFAFPIRKPLKEKTLVTNTQGDEQTNKKEEKAPIELPLLPFHYLHLNNDRLQESNDTKDENNDKGNPFSQLQYTTVKTWTVGDLAKHLAKFDWKETVSLFQDHEIDGESLFLVSKSQLLTIGVNENHADLICEFVKS